jgi:hypothetical protein
MPSRSAPVRRAAITLLLAFVFFNLIGLFVGLFLDEGWRGSPGWLRVVAVPVTAGLALIGAGLLRGYLPTLRTRISDWNRRSNDWSAEHAAIVVGLFVGFGFLWGASQHDLITGLVAALGWGGLGWLSVRGQRRRGGGTTPA